MKNKISFLKMKTKNKILNVAQDLFNKAHCIELAKAVNIVLANDNLKTKFDN